MFVLIFVKWFTTLQVLLKSSFLVWFLMNFGLMVIPAGVFSFVVLKVDPRLINISTLVYAVRLIYLRSLIRITAENNDSWSPPFLCLHFVQVKDRHQSNSWNMTKGPTHPQLCRSAYTPHKMMMSTVRWIWWGSWIFFFLYSLAVLDY